MTPQEIETLFQEAIKERGVHNKLGVTKDVVYNYRNNRGNISFGDKILVLLKLDMIKISLNFNLDKGDKSLEVIKKTERPQFPEDRKDFTQTELPGHFEKIMGDWIHVLKKD